MKAEELFTGIDGPLFKKQRSWLNTVIDSLPAHSYKAREAMEGIQALCDSIADVAHDEYGKDTLLHGVSQNFYRCPCGEEWEDSSDCSCNDRCPVCNKEIEPYKTEEG